MCSPLPACLQRQRVEQQAAQVLQQKAEILDKVRHRFRRAIENEDDEPEQEAAVAGALEDGKQQVSFASLQGVAAVYLGCQFELSDVWVKPGPQGIGGR